MAKKPDASPPARVVPPISESASAHAPFLYFEDAPTFGHVNGIIQITLEALRLYSTGVENDNIGRDRVLVAHLRMNTAAALALKAAIEGALLLALPATSETKN